MSVRWGILGPGAIAEQFVGDLRFAGLDVAAVASRSRERAADFAARHRIRRVYEGYERMLADPGIDAIYIATPLPLHAEHARLAIAAGKHVLMEKPFTVDEDEAADLVELARNAGVSLMEGMWTRYLPHMMRLHELLDAGVLGDPVAVTADLGQRFPATNFTRLHSSALGGGALYDLGAYPIAFAVSVLGPAVQIQGVGDVAPGRVDENTAVVLKHGGGAVSLSQMGLKAKSTVRASIVGTRQRVEIDALWYRASSYTRFDGDNYVVERFENPCPNRGMQFEALELERLIADGLFESAAWSHAEMIETARILRVVREQLGLSFTA